MPASTDHSYRVVCCVEDGHLRAQVSGWVEGYAQTLGFFREILAELRNADVSGVLIVDESKGVVPSPDELERLARVLSSEGFARVPVAYVDVAGTAIARIEAGEIRAREQGYAFRVFDNERLARIWLHYGVGASVREE